MVFVSKCQSFDSNFNHHNVHMRVCVNFIYIFFLSCVVHLTAALMSSHWHAAIHKWFFLVLLYSLHSKQKTKIWNETAQFPLYGTLLNCFEIVALDTHPNISTPFYQLPLLLAVIFFRPIRLCKWANDVYHFRHALFSIIEIKNVFLFQVSTLFSVRIWISNSKYTIFMIFGWRFYLVFYYWKLIIQWNFENSNMSISRGERLSRDIRCL